MVPSKYRHDILILTHDHQLAGHLGINTSYNWVLRHVFCPGLKRDVVQNCKLCHMCQVTSKPNQKVPPAQLYLIPAVSEPFEWVIVDFVGPFPCRKSSNKFLTIMCTTTIFPVAIPLRKISASVFGLPKVVQTDQGTNFMSRIFAEVLKQLERRVRLSGSTKRSSRCCEHTAWNLKRTG